MTAIGSGSPRYRIPQEEILPCRQVLIEPRLVMTRPYEFVLSRFFLDRYQMRQTILTLQLPLSRFGTNKSPIRRWRTSHSGPTT
jgi:hypothetical protein